MPTPIMHLALAEEILHDGVLPTSTRRLLTQQRGPFLLGNTAPDVQTVSGQARDKTHFYSIPRTTDRPAHETLFAAHPRLARAESLAPEQAAFVAGYIAHLLLDELWVNNIFLPYFSSADPTWGTRCERHFSHNVLRTWMDARDQQRINGNLSAALQEAKPQTWLPFVADQHLQAWRDWLVEQLAPGHVIETVQVFARRMDAPVVEMEAVLKSPQQMEERVFCRIPRTTLQSFRDTGYTHSIALIVQYLETN
ncbi:MAG: zinc dependent phospholipase C family protein [Chloroflexi bacterium]|nr:zinc dependent phospholipase C family protein [Chloroflexota bacterium]